MEQTAAKKIMIAVETEEIEGFFHAVSPIKVSPIISTRYSRVEGKNTTAPWYFR